MADYRYDALDRLSEQVTTRHDTTTADGAVTDEERVEYDYLRSMEPTSKYPSGYVRYYDEHGQPLDVFGKPGPGSATHIPRDYRRPGRDGLSERTRP